MWRLHHREARRGEGLRKAELETARVREAQAMVELQEARQGSPNE